MSFYLSTCHVVGFFLNYQIVILACIINYNNGCKVVTFLSVPYVLLSFVAILPQRKALSLILESLWTHRFFKLWLNELRVQLTRTIQVCQIFFRSRILEVRMVPAVDHPQCQSYSDNNEQVCIRFFIRVFKLGVIFEDKNMHYCW